MSSYRTPMSKICDYGYSLSRPDPYRCGIDVLNETLSNDFSSKLQKMKTYAKEIVSLVSGDKYQIIMSNAQLLDDLQEVRGGLSRIARKIEERIKMLNFALGNVALCKRTFSKLSEPVIDKTTDLFVSITQTLDQDELLTECQRVFGRFPDAIKDPSSAVRWMHDELEKIDLERYKKISEEYASSSKDMESLSQQLGKIADKVVLRVTQNTKV